MNGKMIVVGMLNADSMYERNNRVYSSCGISPTITARDHKDRSTQNLNRGKDVCRKR